MHRRFVLLLLCLALAGAVAAQTNTLEFSYAREARQTPVQITGLNISSLMYQNPDFFDRDFSAQLQVRHRFKDSSYFYDAGVRLRVMAQARPFSFTDNLENSRWFVSGSARPVLDLSLAAGYEYKWKRLSASVRAGLSGFYCLVKEDTSKLNDMGNTLVSMGYRGNALKLGFLTGFDVNFWFTKRCYVGLDVTYSHAFNQDYVYLAREKSKYTSQPDYLYAWKAQALHTGIHLGLYIPPTKRKTSIR